MDRWKSGRESRSSGADEGAAKKVEACPSINEPVRSINGSMAMRRRKRVAVLVLVALAVPVVFAVYESRFAFHEQGTAGGFAVESVSLVNLIATPEKYHGKWVRVEGVCAFDFEGNGLYLSKDDRKHMHTKNAVWASYNTLGAEAYNLPFMFKFSSRHVLTEGYFDAHSHGHMGLFSGAITNVTRIMTE